MSKIAFIAVIGVLVSGLLALAALVLIDAGAANGLVVDAFQTKTHRAISFRRLNFHLLQSDPTIIVEGMRIGSPRAIAQDDLVRIGHGVFHVRLLPLILGHVTLTGVELADVDLRMVRLGHERNNYSFGGGAGLSPTLHNVGHMTIVKSTVSYLDPDRQLTLRSRVDYDSRLGARPMSLVGGGVDHGQPYTVLAKGAPLTGRDQTTPFAFDANLVDGAVNVTMSGATQKPFDFREFELNIHGFGPNLADLGYLFGVSVPNTPPFVLATRATHHNHVVSFQKINGKLGGSIVEGDFTSDHSHERRVVTAHVVASVLRAEDLAVFFSARPPHADTRTHAGVAAKSSSADQKPFDIAGFQSLDAVLDVRATTLTGYPVPLDNLHLHLQLQDGHMDIRPFSATLARGEIHGEVSVNAGSNGLAVSGDAQVRDVQTTELTLSKSLSGVFDGAAHLASAGRSSHQLLAGAQGALSFRLRDGLIKKSQADVLAGEPLKGGLTALAAKSAKVALTCAGGRFALRNSVLTPTKLVIVTSEGRAVGQGSIDLASRRIDLVLSPAPQGGSNTAINAPVRLTGELQHPKVSIDVAHAIKQSGLKTIAPLLSSLFKSNAPAPALTACPTPN